MILFLELLLLVGKRRRDVGVVFVYWNFVSKEPIALGELVKGRQGGPGIDLARISNFLSRSSWFRRACDLKLRYQ